MDPWTLAALVRAAGLDATLHADARVAGLSYDPRGAQEGDLFCCIRGERADGHDFAPEVVARGATALLVERDLDIDVPQARVPSVREAMPPLADAFFRHPSRQLDVAAVTGTNGKTTVTYLLESIARAAGRTPGVIGTVSRRFPGAEEPAPRGTRAVLRAPGGAIEIATPLVGRYNIANCMCATGMALQCDIDAEDIARGIEALASVPGRLE